VLALGAQASFGEQHRYIRFLDVGYRVGSPLQFDSAPQSGFGEGVEVGDVSTSGVVFRVGLRVELGRRSILQVRVRRGSTGR
jgi:hypothetical protein